MALLCFPSAEINAISENTETLRLGPHVTTEYVGPSSERRPEVCERSCEELGNMVQELSGLHVLVNQLSENLKRVVGARAGLQGSQGTGNSAAGPSRRVSTLLGLAVPGARCKNPQFSGEASAGTLAQYSALLREVG